MIVYKQTIQKMNLLLATTLGLCIASMAFPTNGNDVNVMARFLDTAIFDEMAKIKSKYIL